MNRAAIAVVFTLAAAVGARTEEATAPLAGSKQQLQQLQKDQGAAKSGAAGSDLKGALPELNASLQGREALPPVSLDPSQVSKEQARKREAKKNWLVNGYDKLDPKLAGGKGGERLVGSNTDANDKDDEEKAGESTDLIQLYEKQGKANASAGAKDKPADAKVEALTTSNPLAPFLQGWLAKTPGSDPTMTSLLKSDGSNGASAGATQAPGTVAGPAMTPASNTISGPEQVPAQAENPYLLNLTAPVMPLNPPGASPSFPVAPPDAMGNPAAARPGANSPSDVIVPPVKPDLRKPPPSQAEDDKKYFPQLKRF
jgi:hypothetical protein